MNPLAERDLELLSAYLDNQLSVSERVSLERRIAGEPQLRAELDELRATAAALRALEPVRPPRSFTLDPATAPRRRLALPLAWFGQLGSGLAGLALVLLASVQLLGARPMPAMQSAPAAAATEAPFSMREAPEATSAAAAPMTMATAAPAAEMAPAAEPTTAAAADALKEPSPATDSAVAGGVPGGPTSNSPSGGGAAPPASDQTGPADIQASESTSPDTFESAIEAAPAEATAPMATAPWITLAIGIALIAVAVGWSLAQRRMR